ncbi:MAG: phospho-sugar mutase [Bilifractor sp.]
MENIVQERYMQWLDDPYFDTATKEELKSLAGDEKEITDRFYRQLEFGTGGLRGVIGAGTNRMNIYTVRQATQGLANYVLSQKGENKGVAIAYDSRRMSSEFSREAALCLNANGIRTYRFDSLRPTPELSFAVRQLGCIAGIVITASHNPREYNGYKVYWEDGAQITPPHDKNIMAEVANVSITEAKTIPEDEARIRGLYNVIGSDMDNAYIANVKSLSIHPEIIAEQAKDMTIVYTPLHGTGNIPVRRVLRELGFTHVIVEPQQAVPDGNFPTVAYPNPEDPNAWKLALALAEEKRADLVLATDPDADRLGVYCRDTNTGKYISFTGNMSGMLIGEYILRERTKMGTMPDHPALVETIVTTDMAKPMARAYGVDLIEVLTGFKYIGEQIKLFDQTGSHHYVFGLEESYGCLPGTYARDKDACAAVMMLSELAAFYRAKGMTLIDAMEALYRKYGYYREGLTALTFKGQSGAEKINRIMTEMREHPAKALGGNRVLAVRDYQSGERLDTETGEKSKLTLPVSNVLYYELDNSTWCCARPSGTEPKIKFYCGVRGTSLTDSAEKLKKLMADLEAMGNID